MRRVPGRTMSNYTSINLSEKFSAFSDRWAPKIIARMNDYHLKIVKFEGEFVWHRHDHTDEVFLVIEGTMTIAFRDGEVTVQAGELIVVPKGVEHRPAASRECRAMLIEPAGTVNTGDAGGEMTADDDVWI